MGAKPRPQGGFTFGGFNWAESALPPAQSGRTEYADVSREYIATATEGAALKAQVEAADRRHRGQWPPTIHPSIYLFTNAI